MTALRLLFAGLTVTLCLTCRLLEPFLDITPPSLRSCHLETGASSSLTLHFSEKMDRLSVQEAFRLTARGVNMAGRFEWSPKQLIFKPLTDFKPGGLYRLRLGQGAEDRNGNSLLRPIERLLPKEIPPPRLEETNLKSGTVLADPAAPLRFRFSAPMDPESVARGWSFSPAHPFRFEWDQSGCALTARPLRPYPRGERFIIALNRKCRAVTGLSLLNPRDWLLFSEPESGARLLAVTSSPSEQPLPPRSEGGFNRVIGHNDSLLLRFSGPAEPETWRSRIRLRPDTPFRLVSTPSSEILELSPEAGFRYGEIYCLEADSRSFLFCCGAPASRPPTVSTVWVQVGSTPALAVISANTLPELTGEQQPITFYLGIEAPAAVTTESLLSSVAFGAGNGCMALDIRRFQRRPDLPAGLPDLPEDQSWYAFSGTAVPGEAPGVIAVRISPGLKTKSGPASEEGSLFRITKP